jgi:gluconolactonase
MKMELIAEGLAFPEGPVALAGGDILVVEIQSGNLTRVEKDGSKTVVAHCGGGPNGAAVGPDGDVYVCNNGGSDWVVQDPFLFPLGRGEHYEGGKIQRVDPLTGEVETLYDRCGDHLLNAPNDIVFDQANGFYFTDFGTPHDRAQDHGVIYYAKADGSDIHEVAYPVPSPNGIGLSPDGSILYVAETFAARLWQWPVEGVGVLGAGSTPFGPGGADFLYAFGEYVYLDSMAIDSDGNICVATIFKGGITRISPQGTLVDYFPVPDYDPFVTNICFGVEDRQTAYITSSALGRLYSTPWPTPGFALTGERLRAQS